MIAVGNSLHYIITLERAGPRWAAAKIGNTVIPRIPNSEATHGGELVFTLLTPFLDFFGGAHAAFCGDDCRPWATREGRSPRERREWFLIWTALISDRRALKVKNFGGHRPRLRRELLEVVGRSTR
jgi:hypothetical protein